MKKYLLLVGLFLSSQIFAQTGIGTTTPNVSAKLDISSSTMGFLPPRVTLTAANTFSPIVGSSSEAAGLLVYNLGSSGLQAGYYYWNGSNWATIATATSAGNGVTASDLVKIYDGIANAATINSTGATFTVPTSGTYLFDFSCSGTATNGTLTMNFYVRDGVTVLKSDMQTSYSNNVHAEYNGKIELNLVAGKTYNVLVNTSSGNIYNNDYCRVYMKQVAGNLPVTGQSVDYIQASLSANQTYSATGNINFNTSSGTGITITSGGFNLIANKTYKLEAAIGGQSGGYAYYAWVDNSNNLLPGGSIGAVIKAGNVHTDAPQDKAVVYFTPTVDTRVFLRVYNLSGTLTAYAPSLSTNFASTWASIQQVGSSAFVNPWTVSGTTTYNSNGNVGIGTSSPSASSILDLTSNSKGLLPPRIALTAKSGTSTPIASPTTGLIIYNTASAGTGGDAVTPGYYFFNGTIWTRMDPEGWSTGVPITLGAITTAPTKGTTSIDYVRYRNTTGKEYEVEYNMLFTGAGTIGSGDYLFTLPGGLLFDFTAPGQIAYIGASGYNAMKNRISSSYGDLIVSGFHSSSVVIPYNTSQFRIMNNNWGNNTWLMHGPSSYAMSDGTFGMKMIFKFKAQ